MNVTSRITAGGNAVIPQEVRKLLGVRSGDRIAFIRHGEGEVLIRRVDDPLETPQQRMATIEAAAVAIEEYLGLATDPKGS